MSAADGQGLSEDQLDAVFPFHFLLDAELRFVRVGPSLRRLMADDPLGALWTERIDIVRPRVDLKSDDLSRLERTPVVLAVRGSRGVLRGQFLDAGAGRMRFVGSLSVQDESEILRLDLTWDDFAIHDPLKDFVVMYQIQRTNLRELGQLTRSLSRRGQELEEARRAAEKASRAKSDFLASLSHEIRTPLHAILGHSEVLADHAPDDPQRRHVDSISSSGRHLLALLSDLLDFTRIEAGQLELEKEPTDLAELIRVVEGVIRERIEEKGLRFDVELGERIPRDLRLDPARVRQVLLNLLENAMKFTDEGRIRLTVMRTDDRKLTFRVEDTGRGIAPELRETVFDHFVRGDSPEAGLGMGLAICQRLVRAMGGEMGLDSEPGVGSRFGFELPLETIPGAPIDAPVERPLSQGREASILLVEDLSENRDLVYLFLERTPYSVTWAPDGLEALRLFRERSFDLVIVDVQMPGIDGYETTQRIRNLETELGRERVPIVTMTAHALPEHRQRSEEADSDDFVTKPFTRDRLLHTLDRHLDTPSPEAPSPYEAGIQKLRRRYLESRDAFIAKARDAVRTGDLDLVRRSGHDLKGTGASYGFPELSDLGSQLEDAGRRADAANASRLLEAIETFVIETRQSAGH